MAALKGVGKVSQLLTRTTPLRCCTRNYVIDLYDHTGRTPLHNLVYEQRKIFPGPYPETEEQRKAAALSYNLHPLEYKPFGRGVHFSGDYPDLPMISYDAKDPYYPWDYPNLRKNFGEPFHKQYEMLLGDRYDHGVRKRISDEKASLIFCLVFGGAVTIAYYSPDTSQPYMDKQYPKDGVHYTFELVK